MGEAEERERAVAHDPKPEGSPPSSPPDAEDAPGKKRREKGEAEHTHVHTRKREGKDTTTHQDDKRRGEYGEESRFHTASQTRSSQIR
jgi:hypothetical protein